MTVKFLAMTLLLLLTPNVGDAKRNDIGKVKPIIKDGKVFHYEFQKLDDGFVVSAFASKGSTLRKDAPKIWSTKLYSRKYLHGGSDIEWIWLKSLDLKDGFLFATDEANQTYKIDSKTGKLLDPAAPKIYEPGI